MSLLVWGCNAENGGFSGTGCVYFLHPCEQYLVSPDRNRTSGGTIPRTQDNSITRQRRAEVRETGHKIHEAFGGVCFTAEFKLCLSVSLPVNKNHSTGWCYKLSSILACELRAFCTMPSAPQLLLMAFSSEKGVYFSYIRSEFYLLSKLSVFIFSYKD